MKKLSLLLSVLVVSMTAYAGSGSETNTSSRDLPIKVAIVKSGASMKLIYRSSQKSWVKIVLLNKRGSEVSSRTIKNINGFSLPYNFRNLSDGKYTFRVTDDEGTLTKDVVYKKVVEYKSSVFNIERTNRFKVSVIAKSVPVKIKILNNRNRTIFTDEFSSAQSFSRVYDLSKFEGQNITFKIITGDHVDYHSIEN